MNLIIFGEEKDDSQPRLDGTRVGGGWLTEIMRRVSSEWNAGVVQGNKIRSDPQEASGRVNRTSKSVQEKEREPIPSVVVVVKVERKGPKVCAGE